MKITLDFDSYDVTKSDLNTRIEVIEERDQELKLKRQYKDRDFRILEIESVYEEKDTRLLRPEELLARIKSIQDKGPAVIFGFSYYLPLWNSDSVHEFFIRFRDLLDSQKSDLILVIQKDAFSESDFKNPRYYAGRIVFLKSSKKSEPDDYSETVTIFDADSAPTSLFVKSYKELVKKICDPKPRDRRMYAISNRGIKSAGLSNTVKWPEQPSEILETIWAYRENIPLDVSSQLLKCCIEQEKTPSGVIEELFGKNNIDPRQALNRICEIADNPIFPAILNHLKHKFSEDSFIGKALKTYGTGKDTFQHHYIVTAAIENIGGINQELLAAERKAAIKQCTSESSESMISEFVSKVMEYPEATCWLNCGTKSERCDLIRRAGTYNLFGTFPESISDLYPIIKNYIGDDFDYGDTILTDYFRQYRANKIMNDVPTIFLETVNKTRAKSINVRTRREALLEYKGMADTAILVVDGMGAEYMPLLMKLFENRGLNIEHVETVKAEIPTITELNPIEWENKIRDIKGIDNTAHDGAEKHVETTLEENIYAAFQTIEKDVMNSVVKNIPNYERIIITADHGLTRLAIRANELKLSNTLDYDGDSWRYKDVTEDESSPPDNVDVVRNNLNGKYYWTIRNYDRFKKKGGIKYETHGGSSVEELMVPFIVIVRDASKMTKPMTRRTAQYSGNPSSQIKEDSSLDELFG